MSDERFASKLAPRQTFASVERAEAFDRKIARARIKAAPIDDWDAAVETGEGPLADALRLLAPEMPGRGRRRAA